MRQHIKFATVAAILAVGLGAGQGQVRAAAGPAALDQDQQDASFPSLFHGRGRGGERIAATLQPENEVPSVSSPARGRFEAEINHDAVEYELSFQGLQAPITQAHIHMAQPNVNGGIMVWLCGTGDPGTPLAGPAGTQTCPQSGTITGIITAENVGGITTQGIAPGEFGEFVAALKKGLAYANLHTQQSPGGEIRGQITRRGRH